MKKRDRQKILKNLNKMADHLNLTKIAVELDVHTNTLKNLLEGKPSRDKDLLTRAHRVMAKHFHQFRFEINKIDAEGLTPTATS